jgi:hypothetical protein
MIDGDFSLGQYIRIIRTRRADTGQPDPRTDTVGTGGVTDSNRMEATKLRERHGHGRNSRAKRKIRRQIFMSVFCNRTDVRRGFAPHDAKGILTEHLLFRGLMAQNLSKEDRSMKLHACAGPIVAGLLALIVLTPARAATNATKDEAVAMVKKAVTYIKDQGPDKAYGEISNRTGKFVDRDLYIVVYQLDGKVLAHGGNAKFVGKDMKDAQDVDGKFFVKERIELAQKQASFWQDYKFVNPVEKKVEPKQMYCERLENTAVCGGIYKN